MKEDNTQAAFDKAGRMRNMGLTDVLSPEVGETYVELNEVYMFENDQDNECIYKYVVAVAGDLVIRLKKDKLADIIGKTSDDFWDTHFPFATCSADPERTDFWSDGIADIVRAINKIANSKLSQGIENDTMRTWNMHYYDSTVEGYVPQTFIPEPWGWYPYPGDPNKGIKTVDIPALTDSLPSIQFLMELAEKSTAASSFIV